MRLGLIATCLFALMAPAFAQETPPLPRPRPDRTATPAPVPVPAPAPDAAGETATEAVTAVAAPPQAVTLTAQITEGGAAIPDGLVWRVFNTTADASGQLAMVSKSDDATAQLMLSPGEYVVHVAYGRAQASDTLVVDADGTDKAIVLDAGALRLNAAITGDVAIPINLLRFDIFSEGDGESNQTLVAQNLGANDIVTLNAGTYHVVSYFGQVNAVVKADLRVEPGQLTDATLYHKAAQVSFKLVSSAGGEAIADVDWTIKTADGGTVFTEIGAFPTTVLGEGEYLVLAKRGEDVFNRQFDVKAGQAQNIEVLTAVY